MFTQLVNRNNDLSRLVDRGYAVAFDTNHLIVRDIPYLDQAGGLLSGTIVTKLEFIDQDRVQQHDHTIFFAGSVPHGLDGKPIPNLGGGLTSLTLSAASADVVVQRSFSNKPIPAGKFDDFFEKIESYVRVISGPAMSAHGASPYTFRAVKDVIPDSVFKFHDTLTSRAQISDLAAKFCDDDVAVIGLGGTGVYVLDFLVKTRIRKIRGFDRDLFHVHTAFRSPGRLDPTEFGKPKADVYQARYENFRHGLTLIPKFIDASSAADLDGVTFAIVCVDKGPSRAGIFDVLMALGIPFIDVGMGLRRKAGGLNGLLRATYFPTADALRVRDKGWAELADAPEDEYRTNIQISELNALNACLAVILFKQSRGFYSAESGFYNLLLEISDLKIVSATNLDEI